MKKTQNPYWFFLQVVSWASMPDNIENPGKNETKASSTENEGWKKHFCSSCSYLACFSEVITLLNGVLVKMCFHGRRCSNQQLAKWKLSLQWFSSWRILHHPRWLTKMISLILLFFLKVPNGWQVVRMQGTHKKIEELFFFSERVKPTSTSGQLFTLIW